jgi:pimeloyl-ACP methyl ester carboxylesterase
LPDPPLSVILVGSLGGGPIVAGASAGSRFLSALVLPAVVTLTACGSSITDPESARCNAPRVSFGHKVVLSDHAELEVHFRCVGAVLVGTLDLPKGAGPFPAVVYVHSSGEAPRWRWDVPWVQQIVGAGIAFFSYDKRGVGESEGTCCPGDQSHFNLLAADADGAVDALRTRAEIERDRIGFLGTSQAGWVIPLAVVRSQRHVAFTALADGPAVTTHEEEQWSNLAGEEEDNPPPLTSEKKREITGELQPAGFDPVPLLEQMTVPGIWVYGRKDRSQPAEKSAATLERLRNADRKDFTVVLFSKAGQGLLDTPPSDPRAMPILLAWIQKKVGET